MVKPGKKARVCVDLSRNLNDFLADEYFKFSSVASGVRLAQQALEAGGEAWFVKLDISSCFLSFPIHPDDLKYYVCKLGGDYVQFLRMVFGLKSAPRVASLLLDVVSAAMVDAGIAHERYLDDFWLVATSKARVWACAERAARLLARFGLTLSVAKVEGPAQVLEYLGVVIDSKSQTLSISDARREELLALLRGFEGRGWASLKEVQSLLGKLCFAAAVLPGARPFMRRMIDVTRGARRRVRLGVEFHADVQYWQAHMAQWNGRAKWRTDTRDPFMFGSDASTEGFAYGLEACPASRLASLPTAMRPGAVRVGAWAAKHVAAQQLSGNIQWGEFFAPLAAAVEYGHLLKDAHVLFVVDNESDVHVLNRMSTKEPRVCALLRALCDTALLHNFSFAVIHRPGKANVLMDWAARPSLHHYAGAPAAPDSHIRAERARAAGTKHTCACSVQCAVGVHEPLARAHSLTYINSRCLTFASSGARASWSAGW